MRSPAITSRRSSVSIRNAFATRFLFATLLPLRAKALRKAKPRRPIDPLIDQSTVEMRNHHYPWQKLKSVHVSSRNYLTPRKCPRQNPPIAVCATRNAAAPSRLDHETPCLEVTWSSASFQWKGQPNRPFLPYRRRSSILTGIKGRKDVVSIRVRRLPKGSHEKWPIVVSSHRRR